jgi:hypothetical protein
MNMPNLNGVSANAPPPPLNSITPDAVAQARSEALKKMKAPKRTKAPRDADHSAAWRACREPWIIDWPPDYPRTEIDLRAALRGLLRSGWNIRALKAYAFSVRYYAHGRKDIDHVTAGAWRQAVRDASSPGMFGDKAALFLAEFKSDPERYVWVK